MVIVKLANCFCSFFVFSYYSDSEKSSWPYLIEYSFSFILLLLLLSLWYALISFLFFLVLKFLHHIYIFCFIIFSFWFLFSSNQSKSFYFLWIKKEVGYLHTESSIKFLLQFIPIISNSSFHGILGFSSSHIVKRNKTSFSKPFLRFKQILCLLIWKNKWITSVKIRP